MPPFMPPITSTKRPSAKYTPASDPQMRAYVASSKVQRLIKDFIADGTTTIDEIAEAVFDLRDATHALKDAGEPGV